MSFVADSRSRQRLAVDGLTGYEAPLKRLRSVVGEVSHGPGAVLGLGLCRPTAEPLSMSSYGASLLGADAMAWPLRAGLDTQMLAASRSLIERNLSVVDASQAMALKELRMLQANPALSRGGGIQLPLPNSRAKTKLCKHFIENNCVFKELCNYAHSIVELKKAPDEGDLEGQALLERYKAKAEAEKQSTGQDASAAAVSQSNVGLCEHFIGGTCKFEEGCHFAHSIKELRKLPEEIDEAKKALLDMYKAKAALSIYKFKQVSAQAPPRTKIMLCKQYIIGKCELNDNCTSAHSIGELASLPAESDVAGKVLLELYQSKMQAQKSEQTETLTTGATASSEGVEKTSAADSQTAQKVESSANTAVEVNNDGKSLRFLKTRMCKHFLVGACKYSQDCTFAHAIEDLRPPAADTMFTTNTASSSPCQPVQFAHQFDAKQNENSTQSKDYKQGSFKTEPCRFFAEGTCRFGIACAFIHNNQAHGTSSSALQAPGEMKPTYKTRLCIMWIKDKTCSFGSNCHFAHGTKELRQGTGPIAAVDNRVMYHASARAQQLAPPSPVSYSYNVTDTNWRPYQGPDKGIHGLTGAAGVINERLYDRGAAETLYLRGLLQDDGQLEQAGSFACLSSLQRANVGL